MDRAKTKRILLLVSSDDYRKIVELGLKISSNWEVCSANSLREGLAIAERVEIDAILLDVDCMEEDLQRIFTHPSTVDLPKIAIVEGRTADWNSTSLPNIAVVVSKLSNPLSFAEQIARALQWSLPSINN